MSLAVKVFARAFATACRNNQVERVTVVGAGQMGSGIAQVVAQAGQNVTVVDKEDAFLGKSKKNIEKSLQRVVKSQIQKKSEDPSKAEGLIKEKTGEIMQRISFSTDLPASVKSTNLVVEAIIENLAIKQDLFRAVESAAPESAILATNTSSLSVTDIGAKLNKKDRYGGLHFFHPVPVMKLLEVVRLDETSEEAYNAMMSWGQSIGKTCITCMDTPGFVVNRLLIPLGAEAVRLLERGVASARDIDIAMKLGAGHPMGPFELMDYTGLDLAKHIIDDWHKRFPDNPLFEPSKTVEKYVSEGKYGVKSGEGFYKYGK